MAVQPIRLFGDPVLRTPADPVTVFDARLRRLADDLVDTMIAQDGAGLAAPQIGVSSRVIAFFDAEGRPGHLVNPRWEADGDETVVRREGCLSIPGVYAATERLEAVRVTGVDADGAPREFAATGLLARVVQHEVDHLDGVLFVQRLEPPVRREAMAAIRAAEWFGAAAIVGDTAYPDLAAAKAAV